MKTRDRNILQITLLFFGFLLILLTYVLYPKMKQEKIVSEEFIESEQVIKTESNIHLGEWASTKLGKNDQEKQNYIQEIIKADMEEAGSEDVFRKIKKDFAKASISIEDSEIRDQMEKALVRENKIADTKSNYFTNVEYNTLYRNNNKFVVKSKKAFISDENPEIVYMTKMKVTIKMKDGKIVVITSDKGIYNKDTYDCYFQGNVKAIDGETTLLSENIDLLASKDTATVYNNVILTGNKGSLFADKVEYDFETKYYKVSMFGDKKVKVKLIK